MAFSVFNTKFKNKIFAFIKNVFYFQRLKFSNLLLNINYDGTENQKKILICYVTWGYFMDSKYYSGRTHIYEIFGMVKVLSELGYCIDIIDCKDTTTLKSLSEKKYSFLLGFGETFYQMTKLQPEAVSILYMTENHPIFSYQEEKKRIEYFKVRHKKKPGICRSGSFYKTYHLDKVYSYVITLSEIEPLQNQYKEPYSILPTGIINPNFIYKRKNHELSRKNFLWLGSDGAIHKGLDLLLDICKYQDDINLHICGLTARDRKILTIPHRKNIIEYGYIDIKSFTFLKLIETCSYIILPSCSEGFSTSIATGMLHGLVPIVMKNTGFNRLFENAIFLDDYKIEYLDSKLTEIVNIDPADLRLFSKRVHEFARQNFTINVFEENFRKIILDVVGSESKN